mmetsp:Transcript_41901/g.85396  ORF Transcript_41901/g.85396 Transcript_41901/m.85396 type:complete len:209 (-) Transcript_41901:42-668(-)
MPTGIPVALFCSILTPFGKQLPTMSPRFVIVAAQSQAITTQSSTQVDMSRFRIPSFDVVPCAGLLLKTPTGLHQLSGKVPLQMLQKLLVGLLSLLKIDVTPLPPHQGFSFFGSCGNGADTLHRSVVFAAAVVDQILRLRLQFVGFPKGVAQAELGAARPTKGDQAAIIFGGHLNGPVLWHHSMTCLSAVGRGLPLATVFQGGFLAPLS